MKKIMIVDDEKKLRDELNIFLTNNGFEVICITNFNNTIESIINNPCDLILLDINLPKLDGEYICKELRKKIETPIIMVTCKNTEIDELLSINYGADDYVTKPYNPQILLARINRILNRNNSETKLEYKGITLYLSKSSLEVDNKTVDLSRNELKIFHYLLKNQSNIVSRDDLIDYLWNNNEFVDDNTLTVNINRLRNKLESLGYKNVIITKRSQGYIIL